MQRTQSDPDEQSWNTLAPAGRPSTSLCTHPNGRREVVRNDMHAHLKVALEGQSALLRVSGEGP